MYVKSSPRSCDEAGGHADEPKPHSSPSQYVFRCKPGIFAISANDAGRAAFGGFALPDHKPLQLS